jgi:hypothetical protein
VCDTKQALAPESTSAPQGKMSQMVQAWNIMFLHIKLGHSARLMEHHCPNQGIMVEGS